MNCQCVCVDELSHKEGSEISCLFFLFLFCWTCLVCGVGKEDPIKKSVDDDCSLQKGNDECVGFFSTTTYDFVNPLIMIY